jgi:vacuolar-type H+-ATPase subunit E/Vma4
MDEERDMSALLEAMRRQADEEKQRIISEAEQKAGEISAQAQAEIDAIRTHAEREIDRQVFMHSESVVGEMEAAERGEILAVKSGFLDQAFDTARKKLEQFSDLAPLIEDAVTRAGDDLQVSVAKDDVRTCKSILSRLKISGKVEVADRPGTVIASCEIRARRIDNSIHTRLERAERVMQAEIASMLFAAPGDKGGGS